MVGWCLVVGWLVGWLVVGWLVVGGWWLVGWLVVVMGLATGKEVGWALIQVMRPSPFRRVTEHAMRACGSGPHATKVFEVRKPLKNKGFSRSAP